MGGRNSALRAESYCDWWSLAGVDALVGEEPAGWLKLPVANDPKPKPKIVTENEPPPLPAALQRQPPVAAPTPKGPVNFHDEWNAIQTLLSEYTDGPGAQWAASAVPPPESRAEGSLPGNKGSGE